MSELIVRMLFLVHFQMCPATNAHGSTSTTQYPKPASYGSGYGSGYDGLAQSQDYGKTGYVSSSQSQNKAGVGANAGTTGSSGTDLSASMYGKSHVTLGKVNVSTCFCFAMNLSCIMLVRSLLAIFFLVFHVTSIDSKLILEELKI